VSHQGAICRIHRTVSSEHPALENYSPLCQSGKRHLREAYPSPHAWRLANHQW
jgi:hypothetical protein